MFFGYDDREAAGLHPQASLSPIRRALKRLDPLPAHCLVQHLAGGSWTAENIANRCPNQDRTTCCALCGGPGTLRHRLWKCPAWTTEREQMVRRSDLQWLLKQSHQVQEYLDWVPTPLSLDDTICHAPPAEQQYKVYTDGSALWPQQKEARLAAWAWVAVNDQGCLVGWAKGLVPTWYLDASAHSGELHAVYQAVRMLPGLQEVRVDCEAVVKGLRNPDSKRLKVSKERRVWLEIRALLGERHLNVVKVQAHQQQPDRHSPSWIDWKGNHEAELMVKSVFPQHPLVVEAARTNANTGAMVQRLAKWIAWQAARMAQEDRQDYQWPDHWKNSASDDRFELHLSQSTQGSRKPKQVARPQVPDWIWELLAAARQRVPQLGLPKMRQLAGNAHHQNSGQTRDRKAALRRVFLFHPSHQLFLFVRADLALTPSTSLLCCSVCHAYSGRAIAGLRKPCRDQVGDRSGQWSRLIRGLHPQAGARFKELRYRNFGAVTPLDMLHWFQSI
eukprot:5051217-Amphidinium_carterae.1